MNSGTATISDVARRAGVSVTTVSRALRGTGPIAAVTNEKVLAAAESLRFIPARGRLVGRRCATGIVLPGRRCSEIVTGCERVSAAQGRSVRILDTSARSDVETAVRHLAAQVDGLVVLGDAVPDALVAELVDRGLPVVTVARPPLLGVDVIAGETAVAGRALARHLVGHGYSGFCFVGGDAHRFAAVREEIPRSDLDRVGCQSTVEGGKRAGLRVLRAAAPPDALLCASDEIAFGVLLAAEELGLLVPGDVAVTGWGGLVPAGHSHPALTTVRYRMREVGAAAARALEERIGGGRLAPRQDVLDGALLVRSSCGFH